MSKIEQLIQQLCPEGVEYKKLGEVCEIITDNVAAGSFAEIARNVKYIREPDFALLVRTKDLKANFKNTDLIYTDEHAFEYLWRVNLNKESIILPNVGNCGEVYYTTAESFPHPHCVLASNAILVRSLSQNNRFLFHLFRSSSFQRPLMKIVSPVGQTKFNKGELKKILIPLPPLAVQQEIVRILDAFTQLEAELEAELEARKKQYAYYRDTLLSFEHDDPKVEWKKLGEVCENICSGGTPSTSHREYYSGTIPWLRTQEVDWNDIYDTSTKITEEAIKNSSAKLIPVNCVIVAMYGATAAKACINKIPLTTNQACCNLQIDESQAYHKYVYYWICKNYEVLKAMGEGSQNNINGKKIKDFLIPLPPLPVQEEIVRILDKFSAITSDLQSGLPAEIEARKKQYEYYRDQLLTFKRKEA